MTRRSPTCITERIDGSQLLDTVERTYFAFRRRLRDIAQATSCECNACVLMPRLDLKVIAHHGSVIRHRIAGREELVGSDVIVAHRLLKNHVVERLGIARLRPVQRARASPRWASTPSRSG